MEGRLLLDVVVRKSAAVLELLSGEDEALLVRGNTLFVLNLGLDAVDSIGRLDLEGDGLSGEGLHEDLHSTAEAKDEMEGRLLLDVVVGEGASILELLSGKDKALLVRRDSFFVLDLGLHGLNRIRGLDLEGDGLASQSLYEDLHSSTETEHQMEGGLLLDVVVGEGTAILQLLSGKDKTLLVRRNSFFVLDLSLHRLDGIRGLNLQSNGLASECLHENLHGWFGTVDIKQEE